MRVRENVRGLGECKTVKKSVRGKRRVKDSERGK
jgi:hypothetical protein